MYFKDIKEIQIVHLHFQLSCKLFLVRISIVMAINKAQSQTFSNVSIYFYDRLFSHG